MLADDGKEEELSHLAVHKFNIDLALAKIFLPLLGVVVDEVLQWLDGHEIVLKRHPLFVVQSRCAVAVVVVLARFPLASCNLTTP